MAEKSFLDVLSDGFDSATGAFKTFLDFELKETEVELATAQRTANDTAARQAAPVVPVSFDGMVPKLVLFGGLAVGGLLLFRLLK